MEGAPRAHDGIRDDGVKELQDVQVAFQHSEVHRTPVHRARWVLGYKPLEGIQLTSARREIRDPRVPGTPLIPKPFHDVNVPPASRMAQRHEVELESLAHHPFEGLKVTRLSSCSPAPPILRIDFHSFADQPLQYLRVAHKGCDVNQVTVVKVSLVRVAELVGIVLRPRLGAIRAPPLEGLEHPLEPIQGEARRGLGHLALR
mmetsp:Transcript_2198/g.5996  ORF Transcript_2198/g.5996 Transcript_2198/m.5996 type:complete len:202 (+) Transcript_2198:1857-2462(+)